MAAHHPVVENPVICYGFEPLRTAARLVNEGFFSLNERERNLALQRKERPVGGMLERSAGGLRAVIAYPNRYWIGMSNLGFQTIFRLLSERSRFTVDRAFVPEENGAECRTFETNSLLSDAHILALSVSFETDYPYVIDLIAQAGIDLDSRRESAARDIDEEVGWDRPFILGGGAALTLNPEPLANFFDAILIGEGEEAIIQFADVYSGARDERVSFKELLRRVAEIPGMYVPAFYRASYAPDGTIASFSAAPEAPERVQRRFVENLDAFPTFTSIQTPDTEFKSMFMTETGRGCEVGCRFCVAGYMYRPVRKRSEETVAETVQIGLETSDSVGFVGAAVSSHPGISRLARSVADRGGRAALSSIMSQRVTEELASSLSESEYRTVALAPEAGSERLRFSVGKRVCDEQIVSAVGTLARNGIRHFKLYFMVGLPSETDWDVEQIPALVKLAQAAALAGAREQKDFQNAPTLFLSVNPFIPKAWTPFQRHAFLGISEIRRKIDVVKNGIRRIPNVEMKFESPRESYFQTVMSRGDRRVGDLLVQLRADGEDWRSLVRNGDEVRIPGVPPTDFYVLRQFAESEILPWEVVDLRIRRSLLEREYRRTFEEDVTPLIARARREHGYDQIETDERPDGVRPDGEGAVRCAEKKPMDGLLRSQKKSRAVFPGTLCSPEARPLLDAVKVKSL